MLKLNQLYSCKLFAGAIDSAVDNDKFLKITAKKAEVLKMASNAKSSLTLSNAFGRCTSECVRTSH